MKLFGYKLDGRPVPLPVIGGPFKKSKGYYVMGIDKVGVTHLVYRSGNSRIYEDQEFIPRCIKDGSYLEFKDNPFDKDSEEWEKETDQRSI